MTRQENLRELSWLKWNWMHGTCTSSISNSARCRLYRERVIIMCVCMRSGTSIGFEVENNTLRWPVRTGPIHKQTERRQEKKRNKETHRIKVDKTGQRLSWFNSTYTAHTHTLSKRSTIRLHKREQQTGSYCIWTVYYIYLAGSIYRSAKEKK